jgi:hypothetical protein
MLALVSFFTLAFQWSKTPHKKPIKPTNMRGFSFSWKRLIGITGVKQQIARGTGIPTTQNGLERKIGSAIIKAIFGKK